VNILFWNINGKNPVGCLQELLVENGVDLLVLAEYPCDIKLLCQHVNMTSCLQYKAIPNIGIGAVQCLINCEYDVDLLTEDDHYKTITVSTGNYELLVAMVHARSKLRADSVTQMIGLSKLYNDISTHEDVLNCKKSIAIGDFNVSPYEEAFVSASGIHAIPYPDAVKKESRMIFGQVYQKFYNPTWRLLGKRDAPYTTYYYDRSGQACNIYWHMFDQVIIRPTLIKAFDEESPKITAHTTNHRLLRKNNTPDKINYSDHLPLFCSFKEDLI